LKDQKPRKQISFDQNLFKSFNFDKAENKINEEKLDCDLVKENTLKDKI